MTLLGSPNCSTSACSVWSTMNNALVKAKPATTRTTARTTSRRRSILNLLIAGRAGAGRSRGRLSGAGTGPRGPRRTPLGRSPASRVAAAQGRQRQIGEHAGPALGGFVDDHLVAALQDPFHGFG